MNTQKYANRFTPDGDFQPIYFIPEEPNYVLEALAGLAGLIAFISFIFVVAML